MILTPNQLSMLVRALAHQLEEVDFPEEFRAIFIGNVVEQMHTEAFIDVIPAMHEMLREEGLDPDADPTEDPAEGEPLRAN